MNLNKRLARQRLRREYRVRGSQPRTARLRATVFRSNKAFSVQIIDDIRGVTVASASTFEISDSGSLGNCGNCRAAAAVGKLIAEKAKAIGISEIRLDRGRYRYHGRVQAFADAAKIGGLVF